MKLAVTGATGFLGSRASDLLEDHGHEVIRIARPHGAERHSDGRHETIRVDAGDPAVRDLLAGCDAVFHLAGIPDPTRAREDPARAVLYIGETQVLTPAGALPIAFEIGAGSLEEAAEKFGGHAKEAIERTVKELQELRRQAASQLVIPQGGLPPTGGMGPGGKIQMP